MNLSIATGIVLNLCGIGYANNALDFNGQTGRVTVSNSTTLNLSSPFTIEAWICPDRLSGRQDLIYKWSAGYPNQRSFLLQLYQDQVEVAFSTGGQSTDGFGVYSNSRLSLHRWTHIAGVFDGTQLALYIDGKKDTSIAAGPSGAYAGNAPVYLGGTYYTDYEPYDGKMDEVRISNVARYTNNFTAPVYEFTTDAYTKLLMHMNEGAGNTTANLGFAGGNGSLNSGVSWCEGPAFVPEPASLSLLALGGMAMIRRKRQ